MPKVYVLQDNPYSKSPKDFYDAKRFGEVEVIFDHLILNRQIDGCVDKLKEFFKTVTKDDYFILVGPPILVATIGCLSVKKFGCINALLWDNRRYEYEPVRLEGL